MPYWFIGADHSHLPAAPTGVRVLAPENSTDLAQALGDAAAHGRTIALGGNSTKRLMAGPSDPADVSISTTALGRVLEYEPHDLTISVEAGLAWRSLTSLLAANRQMVPLDPPFADSATVGGVVGSNGSGPPEGWPAGAGGCHRRGD